MIGLGIGLWLGGDGRVAAPPVEQTITHIGAAGATAATVAPTGVLAGDLIVGMAVKTTVTAPTFDTTVGATLIGSWSSNFSSAIAFWKYAESSTPAFGTHAGANRCQWWAYRFSVPPVNPIGAVDRDAANGSLVMGWIGLALQKAAGRHVVTMGYRAADETIVARTGAVTVSGMTGVSARYRPMRSNGAATTWALENAAQTVSGNHQSIAVEIGY